MDWELVEQWDAEADSFDEEPDHGLLNPETRARWRQMLAAALPPAPARIADIGCGTGTLSILLADMGYQLDALDFSPAMLARARNKASGRAEIAFHLGDAAVPSLPPESFDAVLSRHVLWALADPAAALRNWGSLLLPTGRLVLIEGRWHTGAGLAAADMRALLAAVGRVGAFTGLADPVLWGGEIADERYLVLSRG